MVKIFIGGRAMKGIYKFENLKNGKIYIGQSVNIEKRYLEHFNCHKNENYKGYDTKFYRALRQYGIENFSFEVISINPNDMDEEEMYWIEYYNSYENGYNSTRGGNVTESCEEHPNAKLTNHQVLQIKHLLFSTKESQYDIADRYAVSQSEISQINSGKKWSEIGEYSYPIRKDEKAKGQNSHRAVLNNEIVAEIRQRYVNESGRQIYQDYSNLCSYVTFERALTGKTYTDIPIYKKKLKTWVNK